MAVTWETLGVIRWPLAFSFLAVVLLTLWSASRMFRSGAGPDLRTRTWIDAILFWGGFAFISGILGTLVGIIIAAQSIERAGAVEATLVWGGIKIALGSSALGALILALAALCWFALQLRWRLLRADLPEAGV